MTYPSPFRRILAFIYDSFIILAVLMIATYALLPFTHGHAIKAGNDFYRLYLVLIMFLYFGGFWFWRGQTVGMLAWKIKLVGSDNQSLKFRQVLLRFCLGLILSIVGLLLCFFNRKKQALYDVLTNTVITYSNINTQR